jgi:hypothetical protein
MLKNVTLSAEAELIEKARERARRERRSLNDTFRDWLTLYAGQPLSPQDYAAIMKELAYARPGRKFTRDEMNERDFHSTTA